MKQTLLHPAGPLSKLKYLLISAVLMTVAQPPFPTGWLAYIAFVPFLIGIEDLRGRSAFGYGVVWGLMVNAFGLYWVATSNFGALIGALIYLGLVDGLFTWLICSVRHQRRALLLPFIWTGFFFLKSVGEMGFPWLSMALTQTYSPAALQGAAIAGAWGLDLWVVAINSLVYSGLTRLSNEKHEISLRSLVRVFAPAAGLALIVLLYGRIVMIAGGASESERFTYLDNTSESMTVPAWIEEGSRPLRVAAIQGSVRPDVKLAYQLLGYNLYLYGRLTRGALSAADGEIDLVVWPETAVPQYLNRSLRARRFVQELQEEIKIPILTGAFASIPGDGKSYYYNAAFMVNRGRISSGEQVYAKRLLVPFGERVPYQGVLGFMAGWSMGWSDFSKGMGAPLMGGPPETPDLPQIGLLICYESIFSRLTRSEVVDGAQVLSVITNDAWFGRTSGPFQHTKAAALRAVEYRRPVIRVANSGVTALVDRWGSVHMATPLYTKSAITCRVWPENGMTFYARTGDWLPVIALLISSVGLFLFMEPKKERTVHRSKPV